MANGSKPKLVKTDEEYALDAEAAVVLSYLLEKEQALKAQVDEINKGREHLAGMVTDVVNKAAQKLELDASQWAFNLEARKFVRKEDESK